MKPRTPWMAVVKKKHLEPKELIYYTSAGTSSFGNSGAGAGSLIPSGTLAGRQLTVLTSPSNPR